jgi:aspartate aminotransferase
MFALRYRHLNQVNTRAFSSFWSGIAQAPADKILGLNEAFKADKSDKKINLGVGAYRDDKGQSWVLPSIKTAENRIFEKGLDKEYAPIAGFAPFIKHALGFAYGTNSEALKGGRIAAVQSISGTGGCRLAGEFVHKFFPGKTMYLPNPTWGNHLAIFKDAGLKTAYYPYFDQKNNRVDFPALMKFFQETAEKNSVFLLHACAQNPTGCDLSKEQWNELSQVVKDRQHIVFMDLAYQGFASGDAERDAYAVRRFVEDGNLFMTSQSFAKVNRLLLFLVF